jgi:hypothetical protein
MLKPGIFIILMFTVFLINISLLLKWYACRQKKVTSKQRLRREDLDDKDSTMGHLATHLDPEVQC